MITRFALLSAVMLFLPAVNPLAGQTASTPNITQISRVPSRSATPPVPVVVVEDQHETMAARIKADVAGLLKQRNYQGLDAMAARLRHDNMAFSNGDWTISLFYDGVIGLPKDASDAEWEERLQALRDWFDTDTDSITARVGYACGLNEYAWRARGHGEARDVTPDGWRLFGERLTEARRILIAAERLGPDCPVYYSTRLRVAFALGAPRPECDEMFEEGIKSFPNYARLYFLQANFLLPRWFGARGEWEAFATAAANRLGGEDGDMLYAQIAWSMHEKRIFGNVFAESAIEWPRVKRGFETLCRRYPESVAALSEYCYLAGFGGDGPAQTRTLLLRLGNRVDLSVWKTMDRYLKDRAWTLAEK